jgi:hypothetical protein
LVGPEISIVLAVITLCRRKTMSDRETRIENLMKVSLNVQAADGSDKSGAEIPFEFIYGVGPEGITPFEKALFGKRAGDRIQFGDIGGNSCDALGHLTAALREQTGVAAPVLRHVTVTDVVKAQDREVIKALAAGGGCGECDCGCGGH